MSSSDDELPEYGPPSYNQNWNDLFRDGKDGPTPPEYAMNTPIPSPSNKRRYRRRRNILILVGLIVLVGLLGFIWYLMVARSGSRKSQGVLPVRKENRPIQPVSKVSGVVGSSSSSSGGGRSTSGNSSGGSSGSSGGGGGGSTSSSNNSKENKSIKEKNTEKNIIEAQQTNSVPDTSSSHDNNPAVSPHVEVNEQIDNSNVNNTTNIINHDCESVVEVGLPFAANEIISDQLDHNALAGDLGLPNDNEGRQELLDQANSIIDPADIVQVQMPLIEPVVDCETLVRGWNEMKEIPHRVPDPKYSKCQFYNQLRVPDQIDRDTVSLLPANTSSFFSKYYREDDGLLSFEITGRYGYLHYEYQNQRIIVGNQSIMTWTFQSDYKLASENAEIFKKCCLMEAELLAEKYAALAPLTTYNEFIRNKCHLFHDLRQDYGNKRLFAPEQFASEERIIDESLIIFDFVMEEATDPLLFATGTVPLKEVQAKIYSSNMYRTGNRLLLPFNTRIDTPYSGATIQFDSNQAVSNIIPRNVTSLNHYLLGRVFERNDYWRPTERGVASFKIEGRPSSLKWTIAGQGASRIISMTDDQGGSAPSEMGPRRHGYRGEERLGALTLDIETNYNLILYDIATNELIIL